MEPLLLPAIAFVAGILLSHATPFESWEAPIELALFAILAIIARRRSPRIAYSCALAAAVFAGIWMDVLHRQGPAPRLDATSQETVLITGCVVEPAVFYEGRDQFTLELARHARARVTLTVREGESPPDLRYGQRLEIEARVRRIRNFRNPGSFDFVAYSARRDIYWTAATRGNDGVRVLPGTCGSALFRAIFSIRTAALKRIEALYPNNPYAIGMMEAILIGESTKLEKVWTEHFRRTGTFHALVISGLHVTVLAGTLLFLMRLCFIRELPALAITAVAAWVYAFVSGWSAPVIRAAGGFTLYLAGRYFYRERRMLNLLAAVTIAYLAYDPGQLFEASFQLSFLSVTALAVLASPLLDNTSALYRKALAHLSDTSRDLRLEPMAAQFRVELRLLAETASCFIRVPERWLLAIIGAALRVSFYVYEMIVISAVVQIGLALPMAIYFHRISFSGLSANVIIVPLLSLVVPIGFGAIFTGWDIPARVAQWLLFAAESVANWHVQWEPDWRVPDPPVWLSLGFTAALLVLACVMRRNNLFRVPAAGAAGGLFVLLFLHPFAPRTAPGSFELTAIDVGQGDSLLAAFPRGKLMIIDGGGVLAFGRKVKPRLDTGEDVVSPYLWSRSIRKVDVIVATHAHEDHTGGLGALIDNFHPAELWTGANAASTVWLDLQERARRRGVRIVAMKAGQAFDYSGARIEVLSPPADYVPRDVPKNNDSLAFRVTYGKHSFLLTGDMEKPMEARLIEDGRSIRADVLKVGHHGSRTSSTEPFLTAVHPAFAIISDGFENSFHHPSPDVLARLADVRAEILRTDISGLITIRSDGWRLSVSTY